MFVKAQKIGLPPLAQAIKKQSSPSSRHVFPLLTIPKPLKENPIPKPSAHVHSAKIHSVSTSTCRRRYQPGWRPAYIPSSDLPTPDTTLRSCSPQAGEKAERVPLGKPQLTVSKEAPQPEPSISSSLGHAPRPSAS